MRYILLTISVCAAIVWISVSSIAAYYGDTFPSGADFSTRVALGQISTDGVPWKPLYKYGENNVISGSEEDIWNCPDLSALGALEDYPFLSAASSLYVSSDDALDAGDEIVIIGLDADGIEQTIETTLGTAAATSGTEFKMIGSADAWTSVHRAYTEHEDAYNGEIYIHTDAVDTGTDGVPDTAGDIRACILTDTGQTQMAIYIVESGYRALIMESELGVSPIVGGATKATDVHMLSQEPGKASRVRQHVGVQSTGTTQFGRDYIIKRALPAGTAIWWRADTPVTSMAANASFGLFLVPEGAFR